jgi:peptidoglycan/LPS O-acetylase OafA/YrhL
VIVGHSYELLLKPEPFHRAFGYDSFGGVGVIIFFAVSGNLVTQSRERCASVWDFLWRRALRLLPALWLLIFLTVFVAGPVLTRLSVGTYFSSPTTHDYLRGLMLSFRSILPGVFENSPLQMGVNGSLWTLPIEAKCYAVLAMAGLLPARMWRWGVMAFALSAAAVFAVQMWYGVFRVPVFAMESHVYVKLVGAFALGALCCVYRWEHALRVPLAAVILLLVLLAGVVARESALKVWPVYVAALAWFALALGRSPILSGFSMPHDYSYGLYLYAFPIQQMLISALPGIKPWPLIGLTTLCALACAAFSWHAVERPFLALKNTVDWRAPFRDTRTKFQSVAFAGLLGVSIAVGAAHFASGRLFRSEPVRSAVAPLGEVTLVWVGEGALRRLHVQGWAWHADGVRGARLFHAGKSITRIETGGRSPEIYAMHPKLHASRHSGLAIRVPASDSAKLPSGTTLSLVVELHNGQVTSLPDLRVP